MAHRSVSVAVTLSDLERRGARSQNLSEDLHNFAGSSNVKVRQSQLESSSEDHSMLASLRSIYSVLSRSRNVQCTSTNVSK